MPIRGPLDEETLAQVRAAVRAGEPPKAVAIEFGISDPWKHVAHLHLAPGKRDERRRAILFCLDAGLDVHDVLRALPRVKVSEVVRIARARAADPDYVAEENYQPTPYVASLAGL